MKVRNIFHQIRKEVLYDVNRYVRENYKAKHDEPAVLSNKVSSPWKGGLDDVPEGYVRISDDHDAFDVPKDDFSGIKYSRDLSPIRSVLASADEGFGAALLKEIDARNLKDPEVYNRARISRQLFGRIKNDPLYHPSKATVFSLLCALRLPLNQASRLLETAGYAFSSSEKFDLIVKYCIEHGIYNIEDVNDILYHFDQPLLGSQM